MRIAATLLPLFVAAPALALPPPAAPPNTTVYKQTVTRTQDGAATTFDETTTIATAGGRSRWDRKTGGQTSLFDHPGKAIFTWGGSLPPNVALKSPMPPRLAAWDLGYGNIAADGPPPAERGTRTIAGQQCTTLVFTTTHFGSPELCVTASGIVARFHLDDPATGTVTTFEAETITAGAPPATTFEVPADRSIEEMERL